MPQTLKPHKELHPVRQLCLEKGTYYLIKSDHAHI